MRWAIDKNPLRSLLFTPASNPRMLEKAAGTKADAVIIDLEDAVPEGVKGEARENARNALHSTTWGNIAVLVRVNSCSTAHFEQDVTAVVSQNLRGIVLPKCESSQEVQTLDRLIGRLEEATGQRKGLIGLFVLVESPRGLLEMPRLMASSNRVAGLLFGAEDFCLEMGICQSAGGSELLYPRSYLAVCARAYSCLAIDSVYPDVNDEEGLRHSTEAAKRLGFTGKLAIHPRQVEVIDAIFTPSDQEISDAQRVLKAFEEAQRKGIGAIKLEGKMIDRPAAERARRTLAAADLLRRR